jgi:phosphocarrier protein
MKTTKIKIKNKVGIHARPASKFVSAAGAFKSTITIAKGSSSASAKSITRILSLRIEMNDEVTISADGEDEIAAIDSLTKLIESKFGEE